jgi:glyoxylase-like metal-dependent hydrolase (beta-lactamase superfamily II)
MAPGATGQSLRAPSDQAVWATRIVVIGVRADRLAGVAITHPHPDHYAGLAQILGDREVPIVATREVDAVIRRDDATKEAIVGPMMGPEWPDRRVFPNQIITDGETVTLADLPLRVRSLGPGESFADTILELDDGTVFAGDIAYNGMHAYLADGHWEHWLAAIDRLERELPDGVTLHVGHGPPAGKELLGRQRRYIETFVNALQRHATPRLPVTTRPCSRSSGA